ncbi:MAG: FtsX-like permease family protein [Ignavibacteria bacterium]|nr:FtsX-like permease family protein [Ignavibacteria bacterium]
MEIREILSIAFWAVRANKVRSVLTILGIVVGVFSIIAVMTAVRVLQNSIESGLSQLGSHTFQIQKFPIIMGGSHAERAKYRNRKDITYAQALQVAEQMTLAKEVGIEGWEAFKVVKSATDKTNPSVSLVGETISGFATNNWIVADGRLFTEYEFQQGRRVAVVGERVHKKVFPRGGAVGNQIKIDANWYTVVGTIEAKGGALGGNQDNFVAIPLSTFLDTYGDRRSLHIMVTAKSPEVYEESKEQARWILRTARRLAPGAEDDFAIFSNESLITQFNEFTYYVKMGIGFISVVALIAAGVGIMNIMLVSVTERTREIGIRKAVGAQKGSILRQFLAEAVVLSQIGGVVGVLVGILAGNLVAVITEMPAVFPVDWAIIGFALCSLIGIVFGVYPAWKASNLDPIDALRYE